jgi:hypothetical protein
MHQYTISWESIYPFSSRFMCTDTNSGSILIGAPKGYEPAKNRHILKLLDKYTD